MTYEDAVSYILDIPRFAKKNGLEHTRRLLKELGNPQDGFRIIHVAGTNGKGSVCVYLDAMLRSEGKKTGLFVSPHLVKMNERICVDGKQITDEAFAWAFEETKAAAERLEKQGFAHPTFFEFLFAMAMVVFRQRDAEYVILETGLGGRLDATTAPKHPCLCLITSIGMDHMEYLGDTLEKIAAEKAGILCPETPALYMESSEESDQVIEDSAARLGIFCRKIGKDAFKILGIKEKRIAFSCTSAYYGDTPWELNNIGSYQPGNALLAMEGMRVLFGENGHPELWRQALSRVRWQGRLEEILPGVYVDGAHNRSAIEAFVQSLLPDREGRIVLFSAVRQKEYEEMIACLCRRSDADFYVVTQIQDERAEEAGILGEIFQKYTDRPVYVIASAEEALSFLLQKKGDRTVYCLGSLYLVGQIKEIVQAKLRRRDQHAGLRRGTEEV